MKLREQMFYDTLKTVKKEQLTKKYLNMGYCEKHIARELREGVKEGLIVIQKNKNGTFVSSTNPVPKFEKEETNG